MELTNKIMPWFVTAAVLLIIGSVAYVSSLQPVTLISLFLLLLVTGSGAGVIFCYFRIYAIFERMDRRDAEWRRRNGY